MDYKKFEPPLMALKMKEYTVCSGMRITCRIWEAQQDKGELSSNLQENEFLSKI